MYLAYLFKSSIEEKKQYINNNEVKSLYHHIKSYLYFISPSMSGLLVLAGTCQCCILSNAIQKTLVNPRSHLFIILLLAEKF